MPKTSLGTKVLIAIKPSDYKGVYMLTNGNECVLEKNLADLFADSKSSFVPYRLKNYAERFNSGERLSKAKFKILQGYRNIAEFRIANHRFLWFLVKEKFILVLYYPKKSQETPKKHITKVDTIKKDYIENCI